MKCSAIRYLLHNNTPATKYNLLQAHRKLFFPPTKTSTSPPPSTFQRSIRQTNLGSQPWEDHGGVLPFHGRWTPSPHISTGVWPRYRAGAVDKIKRPGSGKQSLTGQSLHVQHIYDPVFLETMTIKRQNTYADCYHHLSMS